jgi:hypothetical protein
VLPSPESLESVTKALRSGSTDILASLLKLATLGNDEARSLAARSTLHRLAVGGDSSVLTALVTSGEVITWFVTCVMEGGGESQLEAVTSLAAISKQPEGPGVIVAAGGVPALIAYGGKAVMKAGADAGASVGSASVQAVAGVLARLTAPPHTEAVGDGGGVPVLVAGLCDGDVNEVLTRAAALGLLVGTALNSDPNPNPNPNPKPNPNPDPNPITLTLTLTLTLSPTPTLTPTL